MFCNTSIGIGDFTQQLQGTWQGTSLMGFTSCHVLVSTEFHGGHRLVKSLELCFTSDSREKRFRLWLSPAWGLQESTNVLQAHFGRYRDFGLYTDSLGLYGSRMFYYVWDLPIFCVMGAIGGALGALFIHLNVKVTKLRHRYIPVRSGFAHYQWLSVCMPPGSPGSCT